METQHKTEVKDVLLGEIVILNKIPASPRIKSCTHLLCTSCAFRIIVSHLVPWVLMRQDNTNWIYPCPNVYLCHLQSVYGCNCGWNFKQKLDIYMSACLRACVKTRQIKRGPQNGLVNLRVWVLLADEFLPLTSTASPLPTLADAYFSSVKITEKVEQHAEPKCN